jgi:hypothetical protein
MLFFDVDYSWRPPLDSEPLLHTAQFLRDQEAGVETGDNPALCIPAEFSRTSAFSRLELSNGNLIAGAGPSRTRTRRRSLSRLRIGKGILKLFALLLACAAQPVLCMGEDATNSASTSVAVSDGVARTAKLPDFNDKIYYRNKLEFSQEMGVLPINIPFVFDVFVGDDYSQKPLHYTLVPVVSSLRWHVDSIKGPWILRGNTDVVASLAITAIPRGPESHYQAFDLGARRNFVYRNQRAAPYFDFRLGVGFIDAQEPHHVAYAQGQDLTFTIMMGSGVRYNFNPKYSVALGANYMHVSNLYMSEPKYQDNGINVWGPWIGFNVRLGKPKH